MSDTITNDWRGAEEQAHEVVAAHLAHEEQALEPLIAPHVETDGWKLSRSRS